LREGKGKAGQALVPVKETVRQENKNIVYLFDNQYIKIIWMAGWFYRSLHQKFAVVLPLFIVFPLPLPP
jgi:hypothetical protein